MALFVVRGRWFKWLSLVALLYPCLLYSAASKEQEEVELIGAGAYGKVVKRKQSDGSCYALKCMHPQDDAVSVSTEFLIYSYLNHRNILAPIHPLKVVRGDYEVEDARGKKIQKKFVGIKLELMEKNLEELIQERNKEEVPFTVLEIRYIMKQILSGIRYLHKSRIIHRDIKTQNILIKGKEIKICDFGFSCNYKKGKKKKSSSCAFGSFFWRAPELIKDDVVYSEKVDVWAAGMIFLDLLDILKPMHIDRQLLEDTYASSTLPRRARLAFVSSQLLQQLTDLPLYLNENADFSYYKDDADLMDLVIKMLKIEPSERISVKEALGHPFFKTSVFSGAEVPQEGKFPSNKIPDHLWNEINTFVYDANSVDDFLSCWLELN